jgi:hypothetical protein
VDIERAAIRRESEAAAAQDNEYEGAVAAGLNRRRLLTIGGTSLIMSAVVAACGSTAPPTTGGPSTTTGTAAPSDVLALRTASSLEFAAIQLYTKALASNLIVSTPVSDAFKLFQTHHTDHSQLLQAKTADAGGTPYSQPNSLIMDTVITPRLARAASERDLSQLAYDFETAAAASYQADAGHFNDVTYNVTIMSIGGIEARHVSVFAHLLGLADLTTNGAFQKPTGAVRNGAGLSS